jgi:bifunctional ADP-heptose synthase (sugar kinase/adenylyltransferase)
MLLIYRPTQSEEARTAVLAAVEAIDSWSCSEGGTPLELIREMPPIVLAEGDDCRSEDARPEAVETTGGEVILDDLVPNRNTTRY